MALQMITYYESGQIPPLPEGNVFHSKNLFLLYEATEGYVPFFIVALLEHKPVAGLLAVVHKPRCRFLFPFVSRCIIYGSGEYWDDTIDREAVFGEMLEHLTREGLRQGAFVIEFRNLFNALFGYKYFRRNHYFPIDWMRVRNSLHSLTQPMERFSLSRRKQIRKGLNNGAELSVATTQEEIDAFARLFAKNRSRRVRWYFPDFNFFSDKVREELLGVAKIFLVKYKNKIIGGSVCLVSQSEVYLLYSGGMCKRYPKQYPGVLAVWGALEYAYQNGYAHLEFMDAGLPFKEYGYRNFIMRFGGKQSNTRRWFRLKWGIWNKLLEKVYV